MEYPVLKARDRGEWERWLAEHHAAERGVWLTLAKKGSGLESPTHDEALDLALSYGWIDGQARSVDEHSWLLKFTPRGKRSIWSKRNREKVEALLAGGKMLAAGLAAVEAAKQDGRWERAYDSPAKAEVPPDLQAALDAEPEARAFFDTLSGANRYAILFRIQTAVRPETRARRIEKFVGMLARGETIH